jgi:predicted aminopeptidase
MPRLAERLGALAAAAALAGCAGLADDGPGYYWQAAAGHLDVMRRAQPLEALLDDPSTDPKLRERLLRAREIRAFASRELGLPDNRSYTTYAALGRPFVLWNVFATPELSLELERWCFPVAGCVAYRGYYAREDADRFAQRLRAGGLEAHVGGVPAYSTLGWFDDPLLSTFMHYPEGELARLVFHELAHQLLYVSGDTRFNESFATAVEEAGVERWLAARADRGVELQAVFEAPLDDDAKRAGKARVLESLRTEYARLRASWGGFSGYDRFFAGGVSNPQLAAVGAYNDLLPAFRAMLEREGGDLPRFYAAVRELAARPKAERERVLRELAPVADGGSAAGGPG